MSAWPPAVNTPQLYQLYFNNWRAKWTRFSEMLTIRFTWFMVHFKTKLYQSSLIIFSRGFIIKEVGGDGCSGQCCRVWLWTLCVLRAWFKFEWGGWWWSHFTSPTMGQVKRKVWDKLSLLCSKERFTLLSHTCILSLCYFTAIVFRPYTVSCQEASLTSDFGGVTHSMNTVINYMVEQSY